MVLRLGCLNKSALTPKLVSLILQLGSCLQCRPGAALRVVLGSRHLPWAEQFALPSMFEAPTCGVFVLRTLVVWVNAASNEKYLGNICLLSMFTGRGFL